MIFIIEITENIKIQLHYLLILNTVHIFIFYLIINKPEKSLNYNFENIKAASLFLQIVKSMVVSVQTVLKM